MMSLILFVAVALFSIFSETVRGDKPNPCAQSKAEKLRLIKKAEDNEYNIRRIEIFGNTDTRYPTFRKHWDRNFGEGSIFTRESLMKSIAGTNKLKTIKPISLDNIAVRLEENDKRGWNAIDFVICVEQNRK